MKKIYVSFLFLLFALGVNAQSKYLDIGLNFRTDYNAIFNSHASSDREIKLSTLKLNFSGMVYPGITYKVVQRLNNTWFLERDKYSSSTEDAWFNIAPKDWNWDFTIGKQDILFGTFESNYDPTDMYLISMVFDNFNVSQVGATARYTWKDKSTLGFQLSNVTGKQLAYDESHSFAYTLNATHNFFDIWCATVGYSLIQSGNSRYFHWLTLGNQIQTGNNFIEIDAYAGRYRQNMTNNSDEENFREADNFSATISERYRIGKLSPFIKLALDYQRDVITEEMSKKSIGTTGGIEYYPINGQDLRIHAAYRFRHNHYGDAWLGQRGDENIHQFTVGLKWNVNLGSLLTSLVK